ncbi:MAG TPA: hypothetical protein VNW90_17385, partial [Acetobacteraceae bacterium]|nr:hypothetical protein [Acetobacteraceae bacterium]
PISGDGWPTPPTMIGLPTRKLARAASIRDFRDRRREDLCLSGQERILAQIQKGDARKARR